MSQNTPEFTRPQLRRLNREYRKAGRQGAKDLKAAFAMARKDVKRMDPALREGIGRSNLTARDLSAMAQRSVTGAHSANARAELGALGQAAQGRGTGPRQQPTSLVGMLSNSVSRWNDMRRGTKLLKAAYAQAAKDAKTMDPMVRAQIGHSTMTRGDLGYLAQRNLTAALQSPGDFEVGPGQQALPQVDVSPQRESFAPRNQVEQAPARQNAQRIEMLRGEISQLREQIAALEQQVAQLEAAENQPQAEAQQSQAQSTEAQQPQSPEAQQPQSPAQSAETQQPQAAAPEAQVQSPEAQQPQTTSPEAAQPQSPEAQSPEAQQPQSAAPQAQQPQVQSPEAQQGAPEHHVGQHQAVPTDRTAAQQWVAASRGETPQQTGPRGTAQPVFQAAGEQPTTRPGQPSRPAVEQPVFQAAGEQPNEAARKAEAARAAAAAFGGTVDVRRSTPEQAAKTAQSDPNRAERSTGQTAAQKNDPNGRGSR
ncbi:hypothetical protein ACI2LF_23615 [Kribbella sp. NPDC020789]